jgi:hypothetical protein
MGGDWESRPCWLSRNSRAISLNRALTASVLSGSKARAIEVVESRIVTPARSKKHAIALKMAATSLVVIFRGFSSRRNFAMWQYNSASLSNWWSGTSLFHLSEDLGNWWIIYTTAEPTASLWLAPGLTPASVASRESGRRRFLAVDLFRTHAHGVVNDAIDFADH